MSCEKCSEEDNYTDTKCKNEHFQPIQEAMYSVEHNHNAPKCNCGKQA